jgi:glycosyltransferase involved in cell wall biosynthesis
MIIGSPLQYRFALETLRLPRRKIAQIPWAVDTRFWRPLPDGGSRDTICAVGLEMRDYDTLLAALRPLGIRCHIAAANRKGAMELGEAELPPQVTVGAKSMVELRELYARSRFVVVPLMPTDSDQGITSCLEAMAMARAVICTQTAGQVGVLEDGVNAIRVPPRDEVALRDAIKRLWADPELCDRLSAAGRRLVEERFGQDRIAADTAGLCREAAAERRRA